MVSGPDDRIIGIAILGTMRPMLAIRLGAGLSLSMPFVRIGEGGGFAPQFQPSDQPLDEPRSRRLFSLLLCNFKR